MPLTAANRFVTTPPVKGIELRRPEFVGKIVEIVRLDGAGKINKGLIADIIQDFVVGGRKLSTGAYMLNPDETSFPDKLHLVRMQGGKEFLTDDDGLTALSA